MYVHVEAFVPVGIQRLLDDSGRLGLLSVDGGDGEGVRESCILSALGRGGDMTCSYSCSSRATHGKHLSCRAHLRR